MALTVNLRHLERDSIQLEGELPVSDLDIETRDETLQLEEPLRYDLEVEKFEEGLLVEGWLSLPLNCECVRCLKQFTFELRLDPWTVHIPLAGEEAAPVNNDCVDLTPYIREDILLGFPQHPLCEPECHGLPGRSPGSAKKAGKTGREQTDASAWAELNKLKF